MFLTNSINRGGRSRRLSHWLLCLILLILISVLTGIPTNMEAKSAQRKERRVEGEVALEDEQQKSRTKCDTPRTKGAKPHSKVSYEAGSEAVESVPIEYSGEQNSRPLHDEQQPTSSSPSPPPSTTPSTVSSSSITPSADVEEGRTPLNALEFDTFAPGFIPSSPGFSDQLAVTPASLQTEQGDVNSADAIILLDSKDNNGTLVGAAAKVSVEEEATTTNGSISNESNRYWEFVRVEQLDNATTSPIDVDLLLENGTIVSTNAPELGQQQSGNESINSVADDAEVLGTTLEAFLPDSSAAPATEQPVEAPSTGFDVEMPKKKEGEAVEIIANGGGGKKLEMLHANFFAGSNSTEIKCDDSQESDDESQRPLQNGTKEEKKPEGSEFFTGLDEPSGGKENRIEEEVSTTTTTTINTVDPSRWDILQANKTRENTTELESVDDEKAVVTSSRRRTVTAGSSTNASIQLIDRSVGIERPSVADLINTRTTVASLRWTPYTFDCEKETDDRGELLCMEWAKGGLCEINKATRFLFCRKTCLCVGVPN